MANKAGLCGFAPAPCRPKTWGQLVARGILPHCVLQRVEDHVLDGGGVREAHDATPEVSDVVHIQGGLACRVASGHGS